MRRLIVTFTTCTFLIALSSNLVAQEPDGQAGQEESAPINVRDAVVKVHVSKRPPDFFRPWTKGRTRKTSGSGVIISGNRILTNAHVVNYASRIHVQANQSSKRTLAEVVAVAPEVDLALLRVTDAEFFQDKPALEISEELPRLKETINVYGFPVGGEQMSVTEGIISRIECTRIAYSGVGLRLQIDAALNPGNSGGPAIANGKIVGLAFSGITTADNIGYVIAAEELTRFLNDIEDGSYEGKPVLFDRVQSVENEALRSWLRLTPEQGGLLVTTPYDENGPLQRLDVITEIGDYRLDRKGYIEVTDDLKLNYQYAIPHVAKNNQMPAKIVRNGELMEITIPVRSKRDLLIPPLAGKYPSYFIHGPILFTKPSQEFLKLLQSAAITLANLESPLIQMSVARPTDELQELVILGPRLFTHATSEGYEGIGFGVVKTINGTVVTSLAHAAQLLRQAAGEFVTIELQGASTQVLTFRKDELDEATEEILEDEGIRSPYSNDLAEVFEE